MTIPVDPPSSLVNDVRNGLFLASSRTYAEQYVEPFIRHKYGLSEPLGGDHDAVGPDGTKYEIKACKVLRATRNGRGAKPLIDRILFENENLVTTRFVPFAEFQGTETSVNVQNVKRDHFDVLIYVLLFSDCAKIFFADVEEIETGVMPAWSDRHGRYDAVGKSGQFPISKANWSWHLDRTLRDTVTYAEMTSAYLALST